MSVANTSLKVTDLDFSSIRNNLKDYLRNQSEFTDYDFEGSGLSVLLDVLAYNTYYNGFYLNMAANEAFLDTAQFRPNILSHAKAINYVPTSAQGSVAVVNVKATPTPSENSSLTNIVLGQYTRLLGADVNNTNHPFVTMNANSAFKTNGSFSFANVTVKQGEVLTLQYAMTANNYTRTFEIPSANVDISTLRVTVQESSANTYTREFIKSEDITNLTANSFVFFVEENQNLNYNVIFGDGIFGYKPKVGNIVILTYLDTLGSRANAITKFSFVDPVGGYYRGNVQVTTVQSSHSGIDKESLEQIRFRAPYYYAAQNRAVTTKDYEALITKDYPNIDAVSIWGGEDNDPVVYGKVFISLKTKGYYSLSNLEKENIKNNLITNRNVLTVIPEIVDPDYVFVQIRGKITYDPRKTSKTQGQILETVKAAIETYNQNELNTFTSTLRKSKMQYYIENCEPSITGSDIFILLQKQIKLDRGFTKRYQIKYNTPLKKGGHPTERLYSYPQITVTDSAGALRQVFIEEIPESYTGVTSINLVNGGINYENDTTTVTISGDGIGATAEAVVVNGRITAINVTNKGINYTRATVTINGVGSQAVATPILDTKIGTLRTYYYKDNGEKVVVDAAVGTINYETGVIDLPKFTPVSLPADDLYGTDILVINAIPEEEIIGPSRNRIISIDQSVIQTVQLEVVAEK